MESPTEVLTTYCLDLKDYGRTEIRHSCRALEIYIKREIRETFLVYNNEDRGRYSLIDAYG